MRVLPSRILAAASMFGLCFGLAVLLAVSANAQSQVAAADLSGTVVDQTGAVVAGATVRASSVGTGIVKTATADSQGAYQFIALPPGEYEISAEAATFKKSVISGVTLTVGQNANLTIKLEVGETSAVVNVTAADTELVETTKSTVSNTIDQQKIENLPINERSATGFALTLSTVGRDNGRPIGPAPTSGINVGGQRGRSTQVNVDGADFTDNSINAARSTISMEAVQEYQVLTNSYSAEFGRATGGVVNVVSKRGTNAFSGNVFGFLRDKNIQARNAFSPVAKPDFRRTQWGATLGGPIKKDKTFFFAAFERRSRNESGFFTTDVVGNLTSSATIPVIAGVNPVARTFTNLTSAQAAAINALVASGIGANICAARAYAFFASSGGQTALTGANPLTTPNDGSVCPVISPISSGVIGPRFLLSGAPVPSGTTNSAGQFVAFRPLNDLQRVFPISERANFFSVRGDHNFNENNQFSVRFGYNTDYLTGIQVESQNQSLGQNDFSRTGITDTKDLAFSASLNSTLSATLLNEFRFQFGRRKTSFASQNGDAVAYNISGTAFIGRELFSPVRRSENRLQFVDNFSVIARDHTFKFGADLNSVRIPKALFELNFAGLFNFGNFAASNLNPAFAGLPDFTPVQSYGLGLPSLYLQGFGDPYSKIKNTPLAFYAQDSWKIARNLTINYGIRYDVELTQTIAPVGFKDPLTGINLTADDMRAAQDVLNVQQGFPVDKNNFAPRFGFAWDMFDNGKTVVRGSVGLYYDHPLLAAAFNSDIADAAQQQQMVLTAGSPVPVSGTAPTLLNAALVFHGTVCGAQGSSAAVCAAYGNPVTPGVAASAQYQYGRQRFNDQTFPGFGPVLPFTLPVAKDFKYARARQANFSIEHQLNKDMSLTATYIYVDAKGLPHPTDVNPPDTALQIQNFQRFFGGALPTSTQQAVAFSIATTAPGSATGVGCVVVIPGMVAQCPTGRVVAPAIANFFRPNAPNYFLAQALSGGLVTKAVLDSQLTGSLRTPGTLSPFGAVNAQISTGTSNYNALNLELKRRFARNLTFLATYTWSHAIDDSSDLQTLLIAQDVNNFRAERANSLFDQRHRFVFSGVLMSPDAWRKGNGVQKFFADFTIAPIIEISSGRPFNIITNVDSNNDQSTQTDRPDVKPDGTLCVPSIPASGPGSVPIGAPCSLFDIDQQGRLVFGSGSLGRNMGLTHPYASVDLRISRAIKWGERYRIDLIAEGFNLFNRVNEASASPFFTDVNSVNQRSGGRYRSRSTAAYDSRQFQFGAKFSF
ncbi:MAG: TonB-dependent receptor [Acidobacteria bacterium]|nr:TonB-dependent receptor [Acidobacteriota bacterium]